ncbi:protein kinase domain-containing protein [Actinomadura flavalba]|uniref:protein kinase domain-containing protein n=1 Tax=Actinomadura flavalba TaxID=1120938 RepID=UPI0003A230E3|nr:protein kinase [Actinomadura flavalba]
MDSPRTAGPPAGELRPGDPGRIGPYRIEARIGEGGMGAVYRGRAQDGTPVAVKVVRPDLAGNDAFLSRFHDEARNAERVASFCTAQVLAHGNDQGLAYLATEYIEGPSLLDQINASGPLTPGMLHGVAVGVAAALVAIHAAGLVHRDLKPSNVLLSISGPRVIDFGIARAMDEASVHTRTGQVVGTPGYIAPEQVAGQDVTPAVDVFAWGCLVAYAANGRNPFGTGSLHVLIGRALHGEPELGALTEPMAGLVRRALTKDPAGRPSARELLLALVGGGGAEAAVNTSLDASWSPTLLEAPAAPVPATEPPAPGDAPTRAASSHTAPPAPGDTPNRVGSPQPLAPERQDASARFAAGSPTRYAPSPEAPTRASDARRGRSRGLLAGTAALAAAAVTAGAVWALWPEDGKGPAGMPTDTMAVRIDTAPGWPSACHADIGTYTPGDAAPKPLLTGPTCDVLPEWSPDGDRIAFTRKLGRDGEAWVMNKDGGGARKVVGGLAGGSRVAWSPDGGRLAFVGRRDGVQQLFTVPVAGGTPTVLTNDDSKKDDPVWSENGLAFWSDREGTRQIFVLDPASPADWRQVTRADVDAGDPEWSPNGRQIAYTRGRSPDSDIWVVDADGRNDRRLTRDPQNESDAAWSRDGSWLTFVRGPWEEPRVYAVREDGTGERPVTPDGHVIAHPAWGPVA